MDNIDLFRKILNSSKRYFMDGTELTISDYYTGESITIDLERIEEEVLEDLIIE